MDDQWGPWTEHNGVPPKVLWPVYAQWKFARKVAAERNPSAFLLPCKTMSEGWTSFKGKSWFRGSEFTEIIRYRIRKPRGLSILQEIAANPQRELERTE